MSYKRRVYEYEIIVVSSLPSPPLSSLSLSLSLSLRCVDSSSGKMYTGKVAFQLRVHPQACVISQQTTQSTNTRIDPCIPNDKLEWATEFRCSTVLCALLVKLQEAG